MLAGPQRPPRPPACSGPVLSWSWAEDLHAGGPAALGHSRREGGAQACGAQALWCFMWSWAVDMCSCWPARARLYTHMQSWAGNLCSYWPVGWRCKGVFDARMGCVRVASFVRRMSAPGSKLNGRGSARVISSEPRGPRPSHVMMEEVGPSWATSGLKQGESGCRCHLAGQALHCNPRKPRFKFQGIIRPRASSNGPRAYNCLCAWHHCVGWCLPMHRHTWLPGTRPAFHHEHEVWLKHMWWCSRRHGLPVHACAITHPPSYLPPNREDAQAMPRALVPSCSR